MKIKIVGLALAVAGGITPAAFSQYGYGGGNYGNGKCTVEVEVDHAADILVTGNRAQVRTLAGGRGSVVRTNCNAPMPTSPASFRFQGIDGRGSQYLLVEPAANRGTAVVRIEDPRGGRERYTFDLFWSDNGAYNSGVYGNGAYGYPNGGYPSGYPANGYPNNGYPNGGYPNNGYPVYGNQYPNNGYPVYGNNGRRPNNGVRRRPNDRDRDGVPDHRDPYIGRR